MKTLATILLLMTGCGGAVGGSSETASVCDTPAGSFLFVPTTDYAVSWTDAAGSVRVQASWQDAGAVAPCPPGNECAVAQNGLQRGVCH